MSVRKRYGAPEATTQGNVGDLYVDLDTGKVYRCEDIVTDGDEHSYGTVYTNRGNKNTVYVWKSTGASSYNELEDKPFYEEEVVVKEPLNITWDGNTEGLVQIPEMPLFKISDLVLTDEQIKCITITMSDGFSGSIADAWGSMVDTGGVGEDTVAGPEGIILFVRKNNLPIEGTSIVIPEAGIYVEKYSDENYVTSLTTTEPIEHTKTVTHPIDPKFLPDGYPYEEVVVTPVTAFEFELEATDTDNPYKFFGHRDPPFELDGLLAVLNSENVGKTVCVNYDGVQYMCDVHMDNHYSWYIGNSGLMKNFDRMFADGDSLLDRMKDDGLIIDTGEPFLFLSHSYYTVYNYIVASDTNPHNVEVGFCDTVVKKLDPKFLPDNVGGGVKYVTIGEEYDENDNVTYTASATYDEIAEWIAAGLDVKCVYGNYEFSLVGSSVLSEISTMATVANMHHFVGFNTQNSPAWLMRIKITESSDVFFSEYELLYKDHYTTADYINTLIDNKLGVIENGTY